MKASEILQGYLQIKRVPLPMAGVRDLTEAELEAWRAEHPGQPDPPKPPEVGLLPLEPGAKGVIMERGREYARQHGLESPEEGDDLYEYGKALHRCLLGVVDADSDPRSPEPFFDGGLDQIRRMPELGEDGVLLLAEAHQVFTESISGQLLRLTESDYRQALEEVAGPNGFPFWFKLRPGLQWNFAATTASLLLAALRLRSGGGCNSELTLKKLLETAHDAGHSTDLTSNPASRGTDDAT